MLAYSDSQNQNLKKLLQVRHTKVFNFLRCQNSKYICLIFSLLLCIKLRYTIRLLRPYTIVTLPLNVSCILSAAQQKVLYSSQTFSRPLLGSCNSTSSIETDEKPAYLVYSSIGAHSFACHVQNSNWSVGIRTDFYHASQLSGKPAPERRYVSTPDPTRSLEPAK